MTRAELEKAQEEVERGEYEIQQMRQQFSMQLAQKEDRLRVRYTRNIRSMIDSLSNTATIDLVLGYNEDSNVLYFTPEKDITNIVVDGLNQQFEKSIKK